VEVGRGPIEVLGALVSLTSITFNYLPNVYDIY